MPRYYCRARRRFEIIDVTSCRFLFADAERQRRGQRDKRYIRVPDARASPFERALILTGQEGCVVDAMKFCFHMGLLPVTMPYAAI